MQLSLVDVRMVIAENERLVAEIERKRFQAAIAASGQDHARGTRFSWIGGLFHRDRGDKARILPLTPSQLQSI